MTKIDILIRTQALGVLRFKSTFLPLSLKKKKEKSFPKEKKQPTPQTKTPTNRSFGIRYYI